MVRLHVMLQPVFPERMCSFDPLNNPMYKGKVKLWDGGPYPESKFGWSRPEALFSLALVWQ